VPKVKRPGTAYALFVKEKYTSISDMFPAGERSVSVVRFMWYILAQIVRSLLGQQPADGQRALPAHAGAQASPTNDSPK